MRWAGFALVAFALPGCAAVAVVDTAVSVTATVVETTVDVTASAVGAAADAVSSDKTCETERRDADEKPPAPSRKGAPPRASDDPQC